MARVVYFLFLSIYYSAEAFDPNVSLLSCVGSELVVSLDGGNVDGIIFIRGQGHQCQQPTKKISTNYTFDFVSCNIAWGEMVEIVVQERAQYQTNHDRIFPMTCIADTRQLGVGAPIAVSDGADSEVAINITIKPTATMSIYKNGVDISGGQARLGDPLVMNISLAAPFDQSFDIKAFKCRASTIDIINQHCPIDADLFPAFTKLSQGILLSSFSAFRPTELVSRKMIITFFCILNVCRGPCEKISCNKDSQVRLTNDSAEHSISKRDTEPEQDDLIVGTKLSIFYDNIEVVPTPDVTDCKPSLAMLVVLIATATGCLVSLICALVTYRRFLDLLRRLRMIQRITARGEVGVIHALEVSWSIKSLTNTAKPIAREVKKLDNSEGGDAEIARRMSVLSTSDRRASIALSLGDMKRRSSLGGMYPAPVCPIPYN